MTKNSAYGQSRIGSSCGIIRKNGDVIAIAFKAPDPLKDAPMRSVTLSCVHASRLALHGSHTARVLG